MSSKKLVKQGLLNCGGYRFAQGLYERRERRRLSRNLRDLIETGAMPLPESIIFEPTQRCNLTCRMCWQDRSEMARGRELTLAEIVAFFDQAPFLKKVTLIGGEIFLRRDIFDILEFLNRSRDLVICTNGTLISDDTVSRLKRLDRIYTICISLDGNRSVHDAIRGISGVFDRAAKAIQSLSSAIPVTVNCVVQNDNIAHLLDFITVCASLKVKKVKLELERFYSPEKIAQTKILTGWPPKSIPVVSSLQERSYSVDSLRQTILECRRRATDLGMHLDLDPFFLLDRMDACYSDNIRSERQCACRSFNTVTLRPNGDFINCMVIRKPFGNVLEERLDELWNFKSISSFRRKLIRHNMTPLCENCHSLFPTVRMMQ